MSKLFPSSEEVRFCALDNLFSATSLRIPWEYLDIGSNILMEPLRIQDGYAVMPNRPGGGLSWNEEVVKRWLVYEAPSP